MTWKKGEAPWEKQEASTPAKTFKAGDAPWDIEVGEGSADISLADRAIAKNFANSPQSQLAYIKKQYPDADVKLLDEEVVFKKPGDKTFKRMDPKGLDWGDIVDIPYDIASGVAQGAATALGAAGGTALAPGVGTMGGAVAASGAASAGLEGLRQKLGAWLGIPQDVNTDQVITSGAIGAAAPLVFGAGNAGQSAIKQVAAKNGITEDAAKELIESGSKGLLSRGYNFAKNKFAPKVGELTSGIDSEVIKAYAKKQDMVDQLERTGVSDYAQKLVDKVDSTLGQAKSKAGRELENILENANTNVDVSNAKKAFQDRISFLANKADVTNADQAELNSLQSTYNKYFGLAKPSELAKEIPDQISAGRAFDLQKKLKQAAAFETGMTPETLSVKGSARGAYDNLNKAFSDATEGMSQDAKNKYAKIVGIENELGNNFDTAQKAYNTVTGLNGKGKKMLAERLKQLSDDGMLDISNEIETLQAYNAFANPSLTPVGFRGATSTSRSIPLAIGGAGAGSTAGYFMGGPVGAAIGGTLGAGVGNLLGSPTMIKSVIRNGRAVENAARAMAPDFGAGLVASPAATQMIAPWMNMKAGQ